MLGFYIHFLKCFFFLTKMFSEMALVIWTCDRTQERGFLFMYFEAVVKLTLSRNIPSAKAWRALVAVFSSGNTAEDPGGFCADGRALRAVGSSPKQHWDSCWTEVGPGQWTWIHKGEPLLRAWRISWALTCCVNVTRCHVSIFPSSPHTLLPSLHLKFQQTHCADHLPPTQ